LQAVPFFKHLDGVLLAALASRFVTERYAEGDTIFEEGETGDKLYVIVRGQVDVMAIGPTGEERRLAVLRDGDYFGEMALLDDVPRMATVRAHTSTVVLTLDREQFLGLLNTVPGLRDAFDEVVGARRDANLAVLR
jgi:ATP-binding cassette subfamily B protein